MNNIYLTGFMSSGKTVISKELSKIMKKTLYDTDAMIESELGMKITDIFAQFGEEYFRDVESRMLESVSKMNGVIVSTGGGIVLRSENRRIMHESGVIASLLPDFSVIEARLETARATRPLLNDELPVIKKRFEDRLPLYKDCDFEINVDNEHAPEEFAGMLAELIKDM